MFNVHNSSSGRAVLDKPNFKEVAKSQRFSATHPNQSQTAKRDMGPWTLVRNKVTYSVIFNQITPRLVEATVQTMKKDKQSQKIILGRRVAGIGGFTNVKHFDYDSACRAAFEVAADNAARG